MIPYFNDFFAYAFISAVGVFALRRDLTLTILVPSSLMFVNYVLQLAIPALPHTFDVPLWRIDESLGFSPGMVMVFLFVFTPALQVVSGFFYQGLPLFLGVLVWRYEEAEPILKRIGVAAVIGFALFFIVPAQGPGWLMLGRNDMPRNAIPSLHLTWALLIAWNAARWGRWAKLGGFALALFTALATLGFGEHYLIDLIVAVFFAAAIELGFQRRVRDSAIFSVVTLYLIISIRLWAAGMIQ
jgi:hypothetical protein